MNATPFLSSPLSLSALLTPLLWGAALVFSLLAGRSMLQNREVHKRWDRRIEGGTPPLNFSQRLRIKMGRIRFRLLEFAKRTTRTNAPKPTPPAPSTASAERSKKPIPPVLPPFETPNGKSKEAYVWNETKALAELERYTQGQMGNVHAPETTGKFIAATFEHDTARPVDGYAAPQLHAHAVIFNVTERENGQTRSLQPHEMFVSQR